MQYIKRGIAAVLLAAILMTMIPAAMAASYTGTINADKVFSGSMPAAIPCITAS